MLLWLCGRAYLVSDRTPPAPRAPAPPRARLV